MKKIRVALAGNANVGKSAIFNHLTGLHQHIGNWPGKTVEKAEGTLVFKNYTVDVIDLPGIYSFSTFSIEELISRNYIVAEKPDVVINVIDSTVLERNLFFTLQLLELEKPTIIALNQIDLAKKKGIIIDYKKLQKFLNIPVIPTIAIGGIGIYELLEEALCIVKEKKSKLAITIKYGREIEERIEKITSLLLLHWHENKKIEYPFRFTAIKLLEGDNEITNIVENIDSEIVFKAKEYAVEIEKIHGEPCSIVIASERYNIANKITKECQEFVPQKKLSIYEKLDAVTTHWFFGYLIMLLVLFFTFFSIFYFGNILSSLIANFFSELKPTTIEFGTAEAIFWEGIVGGFIAGITLVLPYVLPFYFLLSILEDSGYLPRIAFLLDRIMHKIGLHGKAIIPLIMGYGCNVPACFSCRIMETHRDRLITAFIIPLIPCTARMIVILGLVGAFVGIEWALALYVIDLLIILILGRIAFKILPGEPTGLIMEMPLYRIPSMKVVTMQTWQRVKSILYIVFPYYVGGGAILAALQILGFFEPISKILSFVTVEWLGLPALSGVLLIFGIVRKELVVVMPSVIFGTTNLAEIFTPVQMIVLSLVTMIYIPCAATIAALAKEFGYKTAFFITLSEIIFAILLGGIALRLLLLLIF